MTKIIPARALGGVVLGLVAATFGCGVEGPGIRSISFNLAPNLTGTRPPGYDTGAALMASGTVKIDVLAGTGTATAVGLPAPPSAYVYELELIFSRQENNDIPGVQNPSPNAQALAGVIAPYFGNNLRVGAMTSMAMGTSLMWHASIDTTVGAPLGAVRAASVYLVPTRSRPYGGSVLYGQVGGATTAAPTSSDGHTGHTHGI